MSLRITDRLFESFYILKLDGIKYEKSVNLIRREKIKIWNICKIQDGVTFYVGKKDYEKHLELFEKLGVVVLAKKGVKFQLSRFSGRVGFIVGLCLFLVYILIYSCFAWEISVVGNNKIKENDIIMFLKEKDIKPPIKTTRLNCKYIEWLILREYRELVFAEVYTQGTKLVISVKEKEDVEYSVVDRSPSSIVSNKKAVIFKTIVKNGQLMVDKGQVVNPGDILFQGTKKDKTGVEVLTYSNATVLGYTYYSFNISEPAMQKFKKETGEKSSVYRLCTKEEKYKIFGNENKYELCNNRVETIRIPIISDVLGVYVEKTIQ